MLEKSTTELNNMLSDINPKHFESYVKDNKNDLAMEEKAFYYYMKDVLDQKNVLLKDVYIRSDVTEKYGSQIINMEKHTKNRDLIICFCLGGHFNVKETSTL